MALKDLLVHVDSGERTLTRLRLAVDLAQRHGSRLTALFVEEWSSAQLDRRKAAELGLRSEPELHALDQGVADSIRQTQVRLQCELERLGRKHGVTTVWQSVAGEPSMVVPQYARQADLCIIGEDEPNDSYYCVSEEILFVTGRPVLFVPRTGDFSSLGRHVAIAWNSSRAAARAVNDALPLIEHTEQTTLLCINSRDYMARHGALPPQQMREHLSRHAALVELVLIDDISSAAIADTLQSRARALGADLMVAGAFGHARLREKLLGGVTRDLLARMSLPLMMTH
jgi:nucleotide-binding universal stress UspA family protein